MPLFLAGLLVRGGALPADVVEEALQRQVITGGCFDSSLLEMGVVGEATLGEYLSRAAGLPFASADVLANPDPELKRLFPLRLAERHGLVPFARDQGTLHMACCYPADAALLDEMGFLLSQKIEAHVSTEFRVRLAIERLYGHAASKRMHELARSAGEEPKLRPPPGPAPQLEVPNERIEWTMAEALSRLEQASERDAAISTVLRFARRSFEFVAFFGILSGRAVGWDALGADPLAARRVEEVVEPIDTPSVLQTVIRTNGRYLGPIPGDEGSRSLLERMGRRPPAMAFLQPISIGSRSVALVYADNGATSVSLSDAAEVMAVVQALGPALERMIRSRRAAMAAAVPEAKAPEEPRAEKAEPPPQPPEAPVPPPANEAVDGPILVSTAAAPRPTTAPPRTQAELDAGVALVERVLSARDDEARVRAHHELAGGAEAAAQVLVALLPGALRRSAAGEPKGGPIVDALIVLGGAALPSLSRAASSPRKDVRHAVALVLRDSLHPLARGTLSRLAVDSDPAVAALARAAMQSAA